MKQTIIKKIITTIILLLITTLPVAFAVSVNPSSIVVEVTDTTAAISWTADTASTGAVNYGTSASTSTMAEISSTSGEATSHEAAIIGLTPAQYYYYNIEATDSAGTYTTTTMNFTTLLSTPENLVLVAVDGNVVELAWDEVAGAKTYNLYKDSTLVGTESTNSFETESEDLSYSATYSFTVTAVDTYGRESQESEQLTVKTEEQPVDMTFVSETDITKTTATISWKTDRSTNATIWYGTSETNLNESQKDTDKATTHEFILKGLEEDTTYYYQIGSATSLSEEAYSFKTLGDETPVSFSDITVEDITRDSAEISWITNYETKGAIYYSTDDSFSQYVKEDTETVKHSEELEDMLSGMTYYFKIVVESGEDAETESDIYNFTTSESLYDFIDMEEVPALWNDEILLMKGTTAENGKVYIFVNKESNPYAQVMIDINGTSFEANVTLNPYSYVEGVKGRNIIEIDSWNANNNKAAKTLTVDVDTAGPTLTVNDISTYTNLDEINISGFTDVGAIVTFLIDEKSKGSLYVSNESGYFDYQLPVGTATANHTIIVEAADEAGNTATWEKLIYVDRQDPKLAFYTSFSGTTHYKLFRIDGNTEPGAFISVTNFGEFSGCDDINFQTKYGECDYLANVYGPGPYQSLEALADPTSLMIDLLSMGIGWPTTTVADEKGNFSIIVSLLPGEQETQLVGKNTLVFNVTDQAGNKYDTEKQVKFQPSCIDWIIGKTTSFPINIYTQDLTAGDILGSALFEVNYIGAGTPDVSKITVKEDDTGGKLVKQGTVELGTTESLYYSQSYGGLENSNEYMTLSSQAVRSTEYDKEGRKVYVYVPVTLNRYKDNVDELPEQFGVYLDMYLSYEDGTGQVASCHIYPALSYDIQKPESLTKWLSPTMINQSIAFLDQTINVTESAVKYLGLAARWTTVGCGAMIAWNYLQGFSGGNYKTNTETGSRCNTNLKSIYWVCDRILCPPISPNCEGFLKIDGYTVNGKSYGTTPEQLTAGQAAYNTQLKTNQETEAGLQEKYETYKKSTDKDATFAEFYTNYKKTDSDEANKYDYDYSLSKPDKFKTSYEDQDITISYYDVDEKVTKGKTAGDVYDIEDCENPDNVKTMIVFTGLEKEETPGFSIAGSKSQKRTDVWCSDKFKEDLEEPNSANIPGCYSEDCPKYDNTKCLFGKGYNMNPAEDLFGSLQCGCITGAKGHLENLLKIMYGAKKCLQQALIGETTAGYCERLMSYFVCDILTQIFKHIFKSLKQGTGVAAGLFGPEALENYQENAESISTGLKDRYGKIVKNQLGLSTDDLINKACLAAFTADWSVLEGALDAIVDEVPVAPIASLQGTSRPYGFDPFTGKITIAYNLYVGIVPGGDTYVKAWMECDKGYEGGEYCAQTGSDKIDLVAKGKVRGKFTKDDFFDENILYIDENSASWYNKVVLQLTYVVGGKEKTDTIVKPITKKGDIKMLDCKFSPMTGIDCSIGAEFQDITGGVGGTVQLYSSTQGTELSPNINTYYDDNQIAGLIKINNAYANDFYIRVDNGKEFEYWAIGGTETGNYHGLQYYLLWLDSAGDTHASGTSTSTSTTDLADWKGKIIPTEAKEIGFALPDDFSKVTLTLYPYDNDDDDMEQIKCTLEKDKDGSWENAYGIRVNGVFKEIADQDDWEDFCKDYGEELGLDDCDDEKKWADVQEKYSRVSSDEESYRCITQYDQLEETYDYEDIEYIKNVKFSAEDLSTVGSEETEEGAYSFTLYNGETNDNEDEIETNYETKTGTASSRSSSRTVKINVLADMNDNGVGESQIYSQDQKPNSQETTLKYSVSKSEATSDTVKPVIHFIEPVPIIEEISGYGNNDNKPIPLGFTLWDDKQEINTISIGIIGNDKNDNYQCLVKWEYDEKTNDLTDLSSTDGKNCGLAFDKTKEKGRFIGFKEGKPPFFEFELASEGLVIDDDSYYDITILAEDADENQAEPKTKRIKFTTKNKYSYDSMLVCLGRGECSSGFDDLEKEANIDVETIVKESAQEKAEEESGEEELTTEEELQQI